MKSSLGILAPALVSLALSGCSGAASPATPIDAGEKADDVHVVVIDRVNPDNSYPHILIKAVAPGSLTTPVKDGQTLTLVASATDANNNPIPLVNASISWTGTSHGTLSPDTPATEAVYRAPNSGAGSDTVTVTVVFAGQSQKYSTSAAISYTQK
jgi:hypothetical protein